MRERAVRRIAGFVAALAALAVLALPAAVTSAASARIVAPSLGGTPWSPDGIAKLHADLDGILDESAGVRGAHVGILAVDTATGNVLYERHADEAFQVASALKLLVGSVALERLGPRYAPRVSVDEIGGELHLVGGADPLFDSDDVSAIVKAVKSKGRTHVTAVVVAADGREPQAYPAGWTLDDFAQDYAPAIVYPGLEENVIHVRVSAGSKAGDAVSLGVEPPLPVVAGDVHDCTRSGAFLVNDATTAARGGDETLDATVLPNGCRVLFGQLAIGSAPAAIDVAVPDPPLYLAQALVAALRANGVAVDAEGRADDVLDPAAEHVASFDVVPAFSGTPQTFDALYRDTPIWQHEGLALSALMPRFWLPSDNFVGEFLLLDLCADPMAADRRECALDVERDWLRSIGVDPATTTLADGSGLSQYDRITPRDLVAILEHDWNGPNRQIVLDALPIGGARGTIEGIAGTPAAGRVFAKTGSMMHVRGLAGYLATERHGAVTFAFNVDDWLGEYPSLAALRASVLARIVRD